MDTFVEQFARKLDKAKALALKMSINQEVEVLKYVFLFVEQLQKDLIDKLTIKGSLVTFSFIPETGIGNCTRNVFVTPDADTPHIKQRMLEYYNDRNLPAGKDDEEDNDLERFDGFRQTCDEIDEHYFQQFSQTGNDANRLSSAPVDCGTHGRLGSSSEAPTNGLDTSFGSGDSSVSLICLSGPKSRSVSMHCKRTLAAKVRASLNRSKAAADEVNTVAKISSVNSPTKGSHDAARNDVSSSSFNNGLDVSTCSSNVEVTSPKKFRASVGRKCRRERVDGKYTCSFPGCSEKYSNLEHVADHELQHTVPGGHFWPCSQCPQRFKWRHYLRLHLKLQHRCTEVAPVEMPVS